MKKGVSLIVLVITIIIMSILGGIVLITGNDSHETLNISMFSTEILNIQNSVDGYTYEKTEYPILAETVNFDISTVNEDSRYQFGGEVTIDGMVNFNKIDFSKIGITKTKYGNNNRENDIYVVSVTTGRVYYLAGVELDNKTYYIMDSDLYNKIDMNMIREPRANEIRIYDIIFELSNTEYTHEPITVKVKLPLDATINLVTTDKSQSGEILESGYKTIYINEMSGDRTGNYSVRVNYTYKGASKEAIYNVNNFDDTPPEVNIQRNQNAINDGENGELKSFQLDIQDDIKIVKSKYDVDIGYKNNLELKEYFKYSGKSIINQKFTIGLNNNYVVYIEDAAGNYTILREE